MSYIWEDKNRGKSLYEMAIIKQKALMEGEAWQQSCEITEKGQNNMDELNQKIADIKGYVSVANDNSRIQFKYDDKDPKNSQPIIDKINELIADGLIEKTKQNNGNPDADTATYAFGDMAEPQKIKGVIQQELKLPDDRFKGPEEGTDHPNGSVTITKDEAAKAESTIKKWFETGILVNPNAKTEQAETSDKNREEIIAAIKKRFPDEKIQAQIGMALRFFANGLWFDGKEPDSNQTTTVESFKNALEAGNANHVIELVSTLAEKITSGRIKVDPKNSKLFKVTQEDKEILGSMQIPSFFETEPDDSCWQEIVITDYGVPMINLSHPCTKKVISSDKPEEECPGELKQFKKAIAAHPALKKVFVQGLDRMLGKAMNLLTLGIAAATTDAGKRADRIIKELKDKGGMITHRNLLLVKYEDIVNADPDNEDLTITVKSYNRSTKQFVGEFELPVAMLNKFYSVVDPVQSAKIYIETYCKDAELKEVMANGQLSSEQKAVERQQEDAEKDADAHKGHAKAEMGTVIAGTAAAALAFSLSTALMAAAPALALGATAYNALRDVKGDSDRNDVSKVKGDKERANKTAELKLNYVKLLSSEGHPPYYVMKAKTANKEVDIISRSSTGQRAAGKVLMVTMKIGEEQAAMFLNPKQVKEQFSA